MRITMRCSCPRCRNTRAVHRFQGNPLRKPFEPPKPKSETFWMVWNASSKGRSTFKHPSHAEACKEAERLAKLNPNDEFYVLRSTVKVMVRTSSVTEITPC